MTETADEMAELIEQVSQIELKNQSVEEASLGISIADMRVDDEPLICVNEGFEEITGYESEEILGQNCRFLQGESTDGERCGYHRR